MTRTWKNIYDIVRKRENTYLLGILKYLENLGIPSDQLMVFRNTLIFEVEQRTILLVDYFNQENIRFTIFYGENKEVHLQFGQPDFTEKLVQLLIKILNPHFRED